MSPTETEKALLSLAVVSVPTSRGHGRLIAPPELRQPAPGSSHDSRTRPIREAARKAYFARLALKSSRARKKAA